MTISCPCGSGQAYDTCCGPIIQQDRAAATAEELMRSRYSAYVMEEITYLGESLHPDHREDWDMNSTQRWAKEAEWDGLNIIATEAGGELDQTGVVEFIARYKERGVQKQFHEISRFSRHQGQWFYVDGDMPKPKTIRNERPKVGRNAPCPCGSGKKYKKCCGH